MAVTKEQLQTLATMADLKLTADVPLVHDEELTFDNSRHPLVRKTQGMQFVSYLKGEV